MDKLFDALEEIDAQPEPLVYEEVLREAKSLSTDYSPATVEEIIQKSASFTVIEQRRIQEAIKNRTGLPFGVLSSSISPTRIEEPDDLMLSRGLVEQIGRNNVLGAQSFTWQWLDKGVWKKQEERAVKQWVQNYIGVKCESVTKHRVDSVTDLFKTNIYSPEHEFDIGPAECINTLNGELVLKDGHWKLMPHNRNNYRTSQIPIEFDSTAKAPKFMAFMGEVFRGDPDAADKTQALLEMLGYSLMAHCNHEKFIILVGSGANGKSVLLSVLEGLAGQRNVAGVQPSQFDNSFQRAHLHGKLVNIVTEIKQGEIIDDASLKGIVSGEPTTVAHKFKDPFDMRPFSTCWFGTNHMPHTRDFSDALFRRALVVEFNNTFKPDLGNCDPNLKAKLLKELPGVLNLALTAYAAADKNGFTMPDSCQEARNKWRIESDQVAQFVEAICEPDPKGRVKPQQLYNAYREWAHDNGISKLVAMQSFSNRLEVLGYGRMKSSGDRFVTGLRCARAMISGYSI